MYDIHTTAQQLLGWPTVAQRQPKLFKVQVRKQDICILSNSPPKRSGMARVNNGSHRFIWIHKWDQPCMLLSYNTPLSGEVSISVCGSGPHLIQSSFPLS